MPGNTLLPRPRTVGTGEADSCSCHNSVAAALSARQRNLSMRTFLRNSIRTCQIFSMTRFENPWIWDTDSALVPTLFQGINTDQLSREFECHEQEKIDL